jgi:heat shock protein HslJ
MMRSALLAPFVAAPTLAAALLLVVASPSHAQSPAEKTWSLEQGRGISADQVHGPSLKLQEQQLSGTTGCNTFTATISEAGQRVKIENLSLTRKLCAPRRNEAERAFVRALGETAFLQKEPNRLTFLSGAREPLLVWKKVDAQGETPTEPQGRAPSNSRKLTAPSIKPASVDVRHGAGRHVKQRLRTRHAHRRIARLAAHTHTYRRKYLHKHGYHQRHVRIFPHCTDRW